MSKALLQRPSFGDSEAVREGAGANAGEADHGDERSPRDDSRRMAPGGGAREWDRRPDVRRLPRLGPELTPHVAGP